MSKGHSYRLPFVVVPPPPAAAAADEEEGSIFFLLLLLPLLPPRLPLLVELFALHKLLLSPADLVLYTDLLLDLDEQQLCSLLVLLLRATADAEDKTLRCERDE